jgi:hypothetical protein
MKKARCEGQHGRPRHAESRASAGRSSAVKPNTAVTPNNADPPRHTAATTKLMIKPLQLSTCGDEGRRADRIAR